MSLYKAAFEDSCIPQVITDLDEYVLEANEAFCAFIKKDASELVGIAYKDLTESGVPHVDVAQYLKDGLRNWTASKKYLRGDGTSAWSLIHVTGIWKNEKLTSMLVQLHDTTEKHALLNHLRDQEQETEQFAYIASHDLREPLNTITGYSTLLKKRCSETLGEKGQHFLDEIDTAAQLMGRKIDDLLALSRAGRVSPNGEFSLGSAVEEAKRAITRSLRKTGGSIRLEIDGPVTLVGDRAMVAQVFQNLFSNALKYRRGTPEITIRATLQVNQWLVEVSDNGLGFNMEFKDRIFRVFQRLYTLEEYPGTGIGLAIAKKIVEKHGGKIWPESTPGVGTTFYLTLPAAPHEQQNFTG